MSKKSSSSKKSSFNNNYTSAYAANNTSSSTIEDLFGPKPSSSSSSSSSSSIFGSVFGPTSMGRGRDSTNRVGNVQHGTADHGAPLNKGEGSYYQQQTIDQPCYFSNSIYYGGQEVYSPTTRSSESHISTFKKDDQDDDPNSASRGNWWQGSLYY